MDYGNGSGPVYTSSQALQICYYIPEDVHDPVSMTGSNRGEMGRQPAAVATRAVAEQLSVPLIDLLVNVSGKPQSLPGKI